MNYFQQGDVIIEPTSEIPNNLEVFKDTAIQFGEITGHSHRLFGKGSPQLFFRKGDLDDSGNGTKYLKLD